VRRRFIDQWHPLHVEREHVPQLEDDDLVVTPSRPVERKLNPLIRFCTSVAPQCGQGGVLLPKTSFSN